MIQTARSAAARAVYLDTSAYVERLVTGKRHAEVSRRINGHRWVSSVLLVLETQRVLTHFVRQKVLSAAEHDQAVRRFESELDMLSFQDLTLEISRMPRMPGNSTPRSLDLAHLRTALWFHNREPLSQFVTLDEQQRYAAQELGLPV